ncbi:hypothetical protein DOY81_008071 [Sarcophaga bullata]|nr:hypothetical protein DOY81_008071 [Sarcophaga bullata]
MSNSGGITNIDDNSTLYEILKNCANFQSYDSLPVEDYCFGDVCLGTEYVSGDIYTGNCPKMISTNQYSVSGNISNNTYSSEDSLGENILEENGRISLAYENLKTIPKRIAEKFAIHTKFLDLSYNNFQSLSFLTFFEELHTLILDRNTSLDVKTLPFLPNLKILWINNCDIRNTVDWIYRIRIQCPSLEYLSIMGNPGIKESLNFCKLDMLNSASHGNAVVDYRQYVLQMLPQLQYLDGIHRDSVLRLFECSTNRTSVPLSTASTSTQNFPPSHDQQSNTSGNRKISPSLSFKDFFLLKRRKKSYLSSSTN